MQAAFGEKRRREAREVIADLTYGEADGLAKQLSGLRAAEDVEEAILAAGSAATLRQRVASSQGIDENATWKEQIAAQAGRIRLGG